MARTVSLDSAVGEDDQGCTAPALVFVTQHELEPHVAADKELLSDVVEHGPAQREVRVRRGILPGGHRTRYARTFEARIHDAEAAAGALAAQ